METMDRHKGSGKIARYNSGYSLYLCAFILIAIPFMFISGMFQPAHAEGGDITWQFGHTLAGKQDAHAMAVDSAGYTVITGYSAGGASEDYYTIRIDSTNPLNPVIAAGWPKTYDNSGGVDHAEALAIDSSNNVIVTGQAQNASGDADIHTIKYNSAGVVQWQKTFDGGVNGNDYALAVAVGVKSGVDLDDVYVGGFSQNASGDDDFILIRYPAGGGTAVWQKTYNGPSNGQDRLYAIAVSVNGIAVTGESQNASLNFDCLTIKYDFNGNTVWSAEKRHAGSGVGHDSGVAVRMDSAGNVIMAGTTFGTDADIHIVKYSSADPGTILWEYIYDGGSNDEAADLFIDTSDNVYVTGFHTFGDGSSGFYTVKYDSGGTFQWEDVFQEVVDNNGRSTAIVVDDTNTPDNSGAVYITGYCNDDATGKDGFKTIKYTINTGKVLWHETFNGSANLNDRAVGIALTSSKDVIVVGWSEASMDDYDYYAIEYERGLLNRPTDLAATVISTTQVDLSWTDASTNETGFKIERKDGDSGSWSQIYLGVTPGENSYNDTTVSSDKKYYYRVRAYKSGTPDDNSNYSEEVSVVTTVQTYTPYAWKYTFDNSVTNEDKVMAVATGPDYQPVATGHSYSTLGWFDYYTVKLDRQTGGETWTARYDGDQNDNDKATTITVDENNEVLVSGWSYLYSIAADDTTNDIYTIRYPSTGPPPDWGHPYSGPAGDDDRSTVVDVTMDGSNNYVVVGYGRNVSGNDDIYVIKYDNNGNVLWAATPYDGGYNDYPRAVAFDPSGDIIVTGSSDNGSDYDYFTRKYSGVNGQEIWIDVYGGAGNGDDFTRALAVDPSGNFYVTGVMVTASGNEDFYTIKYDGSNGNRLWERGFNGFADSIDEAVAVNIDPVDGGIVVAGTTYTVNGENDFHTIRYDAAGNVVWERTLDRPENNDFAIAMAIDLSGNVHITGDTEFGDSPTSSWDGMSIQYNHLGQFINGTIINGDDDDSDGVNAIAVNGLGEAFIGGYELNSNYDTDYLVVKIDGDELQVPIPFEAVVHYKTVDFTWVDNSEDEHATNSYELQRKDDECRSDLTGGLVYKGFATGGSTTTVEDTTMGWTPNVDWIDATYDYYVLMETGDNAGVARKITSHTATELTVDAFTYPVNDGDVYRIVFKYDLWSTIYNANLEAYTDDNSGAGLTDGTQYCYRIRTYKNVSEYSRWVEKDATTVVLPAPGSLSATALNSTDIYLTWTDTTTSETIFNIERCDAAGGDCPGTDFAEVDEVPADAESYTDTTACEGTQYYYRINAEKTTAPGWTSPWSGNATATTDDMNLGSFTPSGLTTTWVSEVQIDLLWTDNTIDETGFKIERCLTSSCSFTQIGTAGLDSDIVMLLNMDEGAWAGTTDEAADASGSGNDGTAQNGATTASGGQYGYAGSFDGSDDHVEVAHNADLNILDELTVELWFKPAIGVTYDSNLTDYVVLVDRQWDVGTDSYFLGINSDGKLHMGSSGGSIQSTQATWTADTWYHVVVTYRDDAGVYTGEMYINGVLETLSVNSYDNMAGGTQKVGIGGSDHFINFEGLIDRVAIYDRGLTASEASNRFNNIVRYSDASVPDVSVNYTYRVRAYKTAAPGCGGEWNTAYSNTPSAESTIAAPSDVTATVINTTWIDLTWTDNTASETGFKILRCDGSCTPVDPTHLITTVSSAAGQGTTVSYSDKTACESLQYSYSIMATNASWDSPASSPPVTVTTDTAYAPGAMSVIPDSVTESLVEFEWMDSNGDETGYKIERCKNTLANCTSDFVVDGTTIVDSMPPDNTLFMHMDEALWDGTSGEVIDSSGLNNNGTRVGNATTAEGGQVGRAGTFDGNGDYVTVPHNSSISPTDVITVGVWAKSNTSTWNNHYVLATKRNAYILGPQNGTKRMYFFIYSGGWRNTSNTLTSLDITQWHFYVGTYDGSNIKLYVDGVEVASTPYAGAIYGDTGPLSLGRDDGQSRYLNGFLDEALIFDRDLTADEVMTLYINTAPEMIEGTATAAGSQTVFADSSKTWDVNKWAGLYVYMITGSNAGETRQISSNTANTITVGTGFTNNVAFDDSYKIVQIMNGLDSTGLLTETTYTYRVRAYKTASGCGGEWNSPSSDLVEVTTTAPEEPANLTADTINTTVIRLDWEDKTTSETDFEIERQCLITGSDHCSVETWSRINIDGDPGANDTDYAAYTDETLCEGTIYNYRVNAKKDSVPTWPATIWSNEDSATTDNMMAPTGLVAETITEEQIDLTWIDNTGDETSFKIERCDKAAVDCVENDFVEVGTLGTAYGDLLVYHMDEATWNPVLDSSEGGSNDGTAYNVTATEQEGKFGRAGTFNGSNQYITTPLNLDMSSSSPGVTMSAWVKPDSTSSNWHHVISTDNNSWEWTLARYSTTWRAYTGSTNWNSGFSVDVGVWQHIAVVFEPGVGITMYKNGAAVSTTSIAYDTNDRNVTIARRAVNSNYYFDGLIDEVAIYNSPLSFADIYQLDADEWKEETGTLTDGGLGYVADSAKSWDDTGNGEWENYYVYMVDGPAIGQSRKITSNTSIRLNLLSDFSEAVVDGNEYILITNRKGTASGGSTTSVEDSDAADGRSWTVDEWVNNYVVIETGANAGDIRKITSNTANTLTVEAFDSAVANGNAYKILPYLQGVQAYNTKETGTASGGSTFTVVETGKTWTTNEWQDLYVLMETGSNTGEIRQIASNTSNQLTVGTAFSNAVANGDVYNIVTTQTPKRFSDTGLTIGQTYSYRVRGHKSASCLWPHEYSNIAESTISPPAPSNFSATSGGTTEIDLEWTDNTETETGFKIYRCDGTCTPDTDPADGDDLLVEVAGTAGTGIRTYTDTSVSPGVCESLKYTYSVVATSSSPSWDSYPSNVDDATADAAPAPDNFLATPYSDSQMDLIWDDNTVDEGGFKIYRCASPCTIDTNPVGGDDLLTTMETNFEGFSDTGLAPNTGYNYEVHAFKTATCGWDKSDSASGTTSTLTAPALTTTPVSTTRIDLEWTDDNTSETGTEIFRCDGTCTPDTVRGPTDDCGVNDDCIVTVGPDVTFYGDSSLCKTSTYTYLVRQVNDGLSNNGGDCWTKNALLDITDFQPNYQTKVIVDHTIFTGMQSDFRDLRFYDATAELELPYFIESIDGDEATVYFKTLVNDDVYMYFGNASAVSSDNIDRMGYEFYDNFQGSYIDNQKWVEIDPNNSIYQDDKLVLNDAGADAWNKALYTQQAFSRAFGKEIYMSMTPYNTGGNNHFMVGWLLNQELSGTDYYKKLVHGFYWNNGSLGAYEKASYKGAMGSYSLTTPYEMKVSLKPYGAKYYIKGGAYSNWTLLKETSTLNDGPMKLAFTQHSHQADIGVVKIQNYAIAEPSVAIIGTGNDPGGGPGCFSFSTVWTAAPDSNEASDTTHTPVAPSNLTATTVSDTEMLLSWTDNTDDETGFRLERCTGSSCAPLPPAIATIQGYDQSLALFLRMDETSWHGVPGEVVDSSGNGNDGTAYSGANTAEGGKYGRAGSFDGVNDYVSIPHSDSINPTDAITVGVWAKSDTATWNANGTLVSKRNAYIMYPVSGNRTVRFYVYTTGSWYSTEYTPADITGWHHYAGTYDGTEIKLYIDGAPVGTPTVRLGGINPDTGPLYIGRDDGQNAYFKGLIDEVTIYGSALSDSEVLDLKNQGIPSNTEYLDTVSPALGYCYQVRAYKTAAGCAGGEWNSGYSASVCKESPPAAPSNLTASPINSMVVLLEWDDVANEDGYEIEKKIWGGTYVIIATIGPGINAFYDTEGIEPEQTYTYRISAFNAEGYSDYSNEDSAVMPSYTPGDDTCFE